MIISITLQKIIFERFYSPCARSAAQQNATIALARLFSRPFDEGGMPSIIHGYRACAAALLSVFYRSTMLHFAFTLRHYIVALIENFASYFI